MKKYPKHYAPEPKEWVPHGDKMEWQCCDCSLVHNVWFALHNGTSAKTPSNAGYVLLVKMTLNLKETKKARTLKATPNHK